jgi:hypothetical protein
LTDTATALTNTATVLTNIATVKTETATTLTNTATALFDTATVKTETATVLTDTATDKTDTATALFDTATVKTNIATFCNNKPTFHFNKPYIENNILDIKDIRPYKKSSKRSVVKELCRKIARVIQIKVAIELVFKRRQFHLPQRLIIVYKPFEVQFFIAEVKSRAIRGSDPFNLMKRKS